MQPWMAKRLTPYGATIFHTITAKANAREGCVNLGQGFPDFDGPDLVKEAAIQAIRDGHNQYAPHPGLPALTQAIADKYHKEQGLEVDPQREVTILCGASEAMYATLSALVEPGDVFIVFSPVYDTYTPTVQMLGGSVIPIPLEPPAFRFDPKKLEEAFAQKQVRGIILNTPHNPTGTVFNQDELALIAKLCVDHDCIAICDEVYEYLLFDGHRHQSLATFEGMRERTITISSSAKSFSMTGWKIGWTVAPPEATVAIRRMHQYIAFAIATPFQWAMAEAQRQAETLITPLVADLADKRTRLAKGLRAKGFGVYEPEGTFFMLADFSKLSDQRDTDYVVHLIDTIGLATIPISVFYPDQSQAPTNYIRFCFAKREDTIQAALDRIAQL